MGKYVEPMLVDENGNIYYSAECINGIKDKQQEEIKRLSKTLEEEKNAYNRMYNMYVEKDNIIKELEKFLIEEIEDYEKQIKYHKENKDLRSGILDLVGEYEGEKVCFEDTLGKLQELKGSDKE